MPTLNEFLEKALKDQPINEAVGGFSDIEYSESNLNKFYT